MSPRRDEVAAHNDRALTVTHIMKNLTALAPSVRPMTADRCNVFPTSWEYKQHGIQGAVVSQGTEM